MATGRNNWRTRRPYSTCRRTEHPDEWSEPMGTERQKELRRRARRKDEKRRLKRKEAAAAAPVHRPAR